VDEDFVLPLPLWGLCTRAGRVKRHASRGSGADSAGREARGQVGRRNDEFHAMPTPLPLPPLHLSG